MKNNDPVDWIAVRRAYCAGIEAVASICQRHGISAGTLYSRRRAENWPHRYNMSAVVTKTSRQIHKNKIARLYQLLDRLMKEVEMEPVRVASDQGSGTADRERSARTLSSLIRSFEKIKELEAEEILETRETDDDQINDEDRKEAEALRNILQERFATLTQIGKAETLS